MCGKAAAAAAAAMLMSSTKRNYQLFVSLEKEEKTVFVVLFSFHSFVRFIWSCDLGGLVVIGRIFNRSKS